MELSYVEEKLYRIATRNAEEVKNYRKRFIYSELKGYVENAKGKTPALLLGGLRGVGKTTLLLQLFSSLKGGFYFSADSFFLKNLSLYEFVEHLAKQGYEFLLIDEIHAYPSWEKELKNIYDDFSLPIIASASSLPALKRGGLQLGRRVYEIELKPLSLREYAYLRYDLNYSASLAHLRDRRAVIKWLATHPKAEACYEEYLLRGGFPFLFSNREEALMNLIRKMIYEDIPLAYPVTPEKLELIERLLSFLSSSPCGGFSYESFSSKFGFPKSSTYDIVRLLTEFSLLKSIRGRYGKVAKLLFYHPNLRAALSSSFSPIPDRGCLREEYFVFHMEALGFHLLAPKGKRKEPDYLVEGMLFEIGGESKTKAQFEGKEGIILDDAALTYIGFVQNPEQNAKNLFKIANK